MSASLRQGVSFTVEEVEKIGDFLHYAVQYALPVHMTTTDVGVDMVLQDRNGPARIVKIGTVHTVTGPGWDAVCSCGGFQTREPAFASRPMADYLDAIRDHLEGKL